MGHLDAQDPAGTQRRGVWQFQDAGRRHLRIGFKEAIPVGSVMVKGGGQLSVLKANAAYPGDLARESAWQPAVRVKDGEISPR